MAVALRRPELVEKLVAVDNAPIDAVLSSDFTKYVRGLKTIERSNLSKMKDAYTVLNKFESNIDIQHFLLQNAEMKPNGTVGFKIPLDIISKSLDHIGSFPFHPDKERFVGPSLFIRGTKSH